MIEKNHETQNYTISFNDNLTSLEMTEKEHYGVFYGFCDQFIWQRIGNCSQTADGITHK